VPIAIVRLVMINPNNNNKNWLLIMSKQLFTVVLVLLGSSLVSAVADSKQNASPHLINSYDGKTGVSKMSMWHNCFNFMTVMEQT